MNNQEEVQKVKIITLKDNKNNQQKYMLSNRVLGKGKFGKVYKAVHVDNPDKVFAVKVIQFSSQKSKQQYLKELQIIRHLPNSLNLVKIHSQHLESKNNFYFFEEYCDGGNLYEQKMIRKGNPYTQEQVYNLFYQIVNGFLDLRKANIFHEDIKPQNILIKNNLYKFVDFGISQLSDQIQVSEVRRGTLIYMPPQKLKAGPFFPTSKSQIFSLGITLFEAIFGHHPYLKKKPADYKEYLKLIQQSQVKSIQQLKSIFPSRSLCIDRLIRIIFRMIQIVQSKRLSLQQLQDYVKNTQPFKSMEISQKQPILKKKQDKNIKYQEIGHSHIMIKSQNGIGSLLIQKQKKKDKQSLKIILDICKVCLQFFRDSSGFIQQGLFYAKDSKIYELKQIQKQSVVELNKVSKLVQVQFMSLLFIEKIFSQFQKSIGNFIFMSNIDTNQDQFMCGIESDKQFISNQFLKFYMDIQLQNKKMVWGNLKQKGILLGQIICSSFQKIFQSITQVRINFKQDMLAILFIKFAPPILKLCKQMIETIVAGEKQKLIKIVGSKQYSECKNLLLDYSLAQSQKKNKILKILESNMKNKQILEDDESNQDEFQVLDISDLQ